MANLTIWLDALSMSQASNFVSQWARAPPELREIGGEGDFFTVIQDHIAAVKSGRAFVLEMPNELTVDIAASLRVLLAPRPCLRSFWVCDAAGNVIPGATPAGLIRGTGAGPEDPTQRLYQCQQWVWHNEMPQPLLLRTNGGPQIGGVLGDAELIRSGLQQPFAPNARLTFDGITRAKLIKACNVLCEAVPSPAGVREGFLAALARAGLHTWTEVSAAHDRSPVAA
eukprot:5619201-Amphidinium_carterae.1